MSLFRDKWSWKKTKNGGIMIRLMIKQGNEEHPHRIFINPVKTKKNGYPQYSVFRRGLNLMRLFYKSKILEPIMQAIQLAIMRINQFDKTVG